MTTPTVIIDRYRATLDDRAVSGLCARAHRQAVRSHLAAANADRVRFTPVIRFHRAADDGDHQLFITTGE